MYLSNGNTSGRFNATVRTPNIAEDSRVGQIQVGEEALRV